MMIQRILPIVLFINSNILSRVWVTQINKDYSLLVSKEIGHKSVTTKEKYADFDLETLLLDFPSLRKWIAPRLEKPDIDKSFLTENGHKYDGHNVC